MHRCHKCGAEWIGGEKKQPAVKEYCEKCSGYLHCCLNCRFYDPSKHNQCAIGTTDWVADKVGANFCDEFEFADASKQGGKKAATASKTLDDLFGDVKGEGESESLDKFNKLFGD